MSDHAPAVGGIVTPEAVELTFAEAGLGSRSLAFLLDLAVLAAAAFAAFAAIGVLFAGIGSETLAVIALFVTVFLLVFGYRVACETLWNGRTVGKAAVGLRAVTVEGAPVRFRHAAIRTALDLVDFWLTAGAGALLSVLFTRRSQRLGDLAAGTIVIRARSGQQESRPLSFRPFPGWEGFALSLDTARLRPDQYALVRSFLGRANQLADDARWSHAERIAAEVAAVLGVTPPAGHHPEAFLVAVAAAYQRRVAVAAAAPASTPVVSSPLPSPAGWHLPGTGVQP